MMMMMMMMGYLPCIPTHTFLSLNNMAQHPACFVPACLPACLPVCLPACLPAWLLMAFYGAWVGGCPRHAPPIVVCGLQEASAASDDDSWPAVVSGTPDAYTGAEQALKGQCGRRHGGRGGQQRRGGQPESPLHPCPLADSSQLPSLEDIAKAGNEAGNQLLQAYLRRCVEERPSSPPSRLCACVQEAYC
jgi:hypothetical protein